MENFLNFQDSQTVLGFLDSGFFSVLKFILGIYMVVIFLDIVLLLFQRGLKGDIKDTWIGMNAPMELSVGRGRFRKKWNKIRKKIDGENESLWKVAIIEADKEIDSLISRMGYPGKNMKERLDNINPMQIEGIEELRKAHETRNRIIHEEGFKLEEKEAKNIFGYYENFLRYLRILD